MILEQEHKVNRKINFESKPENLTLVENLIDEICKTQDVTEDNYGNILIALTEAVNNAILHGNKCNPTKLVNVNIETSQGAMSVTVEDEGEGFDFNSVPDPTAPENLEKPTGRGIFLMRNLADEVEFSADGRRVELTFRLAGN
ncbi:MAG: ATP-binding protein [Flavobacteriales bacterium]|nr:ATP-binding protein [Flavobacteriales bacterium]MCB9449521.1 ATP-binding protein [Flavobacteriales bacterium]